MKKILTILGARPQFVKAAAFSKVISDSDDWTEVMLHTGQHFDHNMSKVFFEQLEMKEPEYNLGIHSMRHGAMTGNMMIGIEEVVLKEQPDIVCLYGDTNSTLAGALVASKLHVPIAHIEAGLRAFDKRIPEEINRVMTDHVSDLLFAPTDVAVSNLLAEGIDDSKIFQVGDIMLDTIKTFTPKALEQSTIIDQFDLSGKDFILTTIHRQSNTDDPAKLKEIFRVLEKVAEEIPVVIPLHPRTAGKLKAQNIELENVIVTEALGYLDMIAMLSSARLVITDSGGLQKEAFFCKAPCITVRDTTEWIELVDGGWNVLSGVDDFEGTVDRVIAGGFKQGNEIAPYGDGTAGEKMLRLINERV